jgi:hypothetical protein
MIVASYVKPIDSDSINQQKLKLLSNVLSDTSIQSPYQMYQFALVCLNVHGESKIVYGNNNTFETFKRPQLRYHNFDDTQSSQLETITTNWMVRNVLCINSILVLTYFIFL